MYFLFPFSCSMVIRGDKDEQAVLCSKDKTYDLKIADTSNMLLLIPGCKTPDQLTMEETHCNIIHTEVLYFVSWLYKHENDNTCLILPLIKNFRYVMYNHRNSEKFSNDIWKLSALFYCWWSCLCQFVDYGWHQSFCFSPYTPLLKALNSAANIKLWALSCQSYFELIWEQKHPLTFHFRIGRHPEIIRFSLFSFHVKYLLGPY